MYDTTGVNTVSGHTIQCIDDLTIIIRKLIKLELSYS